MNIAQIFKGIIEWKDMYRVARRYDLYICESPTHYLVFTKESAILFESTGFNKVKMVWFKGNNNLKPTVKYSYLANFGLLLLALIPAYLDGNPILFGVMVFINGFLFYNYVFGDFPEMYHIFNYGRTRMSLRNLPDIETELTKSDFDFTKLLIK